MNEQIQRKLAELNNVEKQLMRAQLQYENERSKREEIESQLAGRLENEINLRKQLEVEVNVADFLPYLKNKDGRLDA